MHRIRFQLNVVSCVLLLLLVSILGYQAFAQRTASATGSRIASVDLGAVLDGLAQRSDAAMTLERLSVQFQEDQQKRVTALEALRDRMAETAQRVRDEAAPLQELHNIEEELVLGQLNYQAWLQFSANRLDVETALQLQNLYRSIRNAVAELAREQGYDAVLVDDSKGELMINPESQRPREEQVLQQMRSRNMLYTSSAIDITNELIERMNNQYRAGQAGR